MKKLFLVIVFWLAFGVINTGAHVAFYKAEFPSLWNHRNCRQEMGFGIIWGGASGPIGTLILAAATGGFQDGLEYNCPTQMGGESGE